MPLYLSKKCKVCTTIEQGDDKLLARLYHSSHYLGTKGEAVAAIGRDYPELHIRSLWHHLNNHQAIDGGDLQSAGISATDKQAVKGALKEVIEHGRVRDLILEKGYKGIKSGKIKLKASDVRAAAKDASDIEERGKDRQVEVMAMIMKVASGEVTSGLISGDSSPAETRSIVDVTA